MDSRYVLVIDDDISPTNYYVRQLKRQGFNPVHKDTVDEALAFARSHHNRLSAITLDIMMPPGSYGKEQTAYGLETGLCLYQDLRKICPTTPVIVLTNVSHEPTLGKFPQDDLLLQVLGKKDVLPSALVEIVRQAIEKVKLFNKG